MLSLNQFDIELRTPLKSGLILLFTLLVGFNIYGQNFGSTPNRIKFIQIETDTVQVVFPEGMDYWGQRVANLTTYMAQMDDSSLVATPIKTSIFIRNLTIIPNGFVAWAPYRSELFTTPPYNQFNGISSWADLLTIHEYRHVEQFSKIMYKRKWWPEHLLFGEAGWAGISYLVLPDWYFEGDATKAQELIAWCYKGPKFAQVSDVNVDLDNATGEFTSFDMIY